MRSPNEFHTPALTELQEKQVEYLIKQIEDFYDDPKNAGPRNFVKMRKVSHTTPAEGSSNFTHGVDEVAWAELVQRATDAGWDASDDGIGHFICKRPGT